MASVTRPPGGADISPYLLRPLRTLEQALREYSPPRQSELPAFEPREWPSPDYFPSALAASQYRGPVEIQSGATYTQPQPTAGNANAPARDESSDAPIFL